MARCSSGRARAWSAYAYSRDPHPPRLATHRRYAIGGSGSTYIYGFCDAYYKPGMTRAQCEAFVQKALAHAMARDGSSGGVIRMVCINESGSTRTFTPGDKLPFGPF